MGRSILSSGKSKTKTMPNKHKRSARIIARLRSTPVLVMSSLVVVAATLVPTRGFGVLAATCNSTTDCQQQISTLSAQNSQAQDALAGLQSQAGSYQDAINRLQQQIYDMQGQMADNQAKQAQLQQQIIDSQKEIDHQKLVLGNDLKQLYINGEITPVEMLATSDNLSDYIDKQEAYSKVQDAIQSEVQRISALQKQLKEQKTTVDGLIKQLQAQESQLAATQAQQSQLLAYNQDQQNQFNNKIASNKAAIVELQRQQYLFNVRTYGSAAYGGSGGYPWANAAQVGGTYNWEYNGSTYDPLGWAYRNCTSYAFWRLAQARGIQLPWSDFPTVYNGGGRIGLSIPDFQNLGYVVDHNPAGATLAVNGVDQYGPGYSGYYGHIMYVESSNDSSAYVSQYNLAGDGRYSTMTLTPRSYTWFVHIP